MPGPDAEVTLRPVTRENVRAICDLRVAADQRELVGPAAYTVAEGAYEPSGWVTTVYADDTPVGVAYIDLASATPYLVRFMIDAAAQSRGFGAKAVDLMCTHLADEGHTQFEVTFVPKSGGAEGFWRRQGFADTGHLRDGEPVFIRDL